MVFIQFNFYAPLEFEYSAAHWKLQNWTHNHVKDNGLKSQDRLHEEALRIAYSDYVSSFEELLIKDKSITIQQKNLRVVAVEMYKISHNMLPIFMEDLVYILVYLVYSIVSGYKLSRTAKVKIVFCGD